MTEIHLTTQVYRITTVDSSAFFNACLSRRRFNQRNLILFALVTLFFSFNLFISNRVFTELFAQSLWYGSGLVAVGILTAAMISALIVFIIAPFFAYIIHIFNYLFKSRTPHQSVQLIPEGLIKHQDDAEELVAWSDIHDFVETRRTLFVFTNPTCAIIIPKRAFASSESLIEFVSHVDLGLIQAGNRKVALGTSLSSEA